MLPMAPVGTFAMPHKQQPGFPDGGVPVKMNLLKKMPSGNQSWEPKGPDPPNATPPRNKALLGDY